MQAKNLYWNARYSLCTVPFYHVQHTALLVWCKSPKWRVKIMDMFFVRPTTCLTRELESLISCSWDFLLLSHTAEMKIFPFAKKSQNRDTHVSQLSKNKTKKKNPFIHFLLTFFFLLAACGGIFHMERGAFNSPGFPEPYPLNVECVWNIPSSPGNRLQLSFT